MRAAVGLFALVAAPQHLVEAFELGGDAAVDGTFGVGAGFWHLPDEVRLAAFEQARESYKGNAKCLGVFY